MAVDLTTSVPAIIIIIALVISGVIAADDEKMKTMCEKELSNCSKEYNVCGVEGEDLLVRCPLPPTTGLQDWILVQLMQLPPAAAATIVGNYFSSDPSAKSTNLSFEFTAIEMNFAVFVARNANTTQDGDYRCVVMSNKSNSNIKTHLQVKLYKALSVSIERDVSADERGDVTLWCNITRPEDEERVCGVMWMLPSTSVTVSLNYSQVSSGVQQLGHVMYEGHLDLRDGSSYVTLYNVTRAHGGNYSCVINTNGSRGTATGRLWITSPSPTDSYLYLLVIFIILVLVFAFWLKKRRNNKANNNIIRSDPENNSPYDVENEAGNNATQNREDAANSSKIPTGNQGSAVYAVLEHHGDRLTAGQEPATCIYSLAGAATADHTTSPEGSCLYSVVNVDNKERKKKKTKEKNEHQNALGIYSLVNAGSS
ncbi:uncharacterized protein LOC133361281 isoform X2 [Lethenteron reissneri]|uniref:uncharacterized protein LOC133361281 isoform X2 n=1 Tax=Lethenteron reissneri TaxID=7753 RepID=UPI002AB6A7AA|nr:uncharacterized protein LOC133361281 isoform X2 [Lethenteron reissneri]